VAIAAIYGGFATGILAILLSAVSVVVMLGFSTGPPPVLRAEVVAFVTFLCASAVVVALCAQLRDLTLRLVDLAQHLRSSEARLGAVVDQAQVGIAEVDSTGRILRTNHQLNELFGISRERIVGALVFSLVDRDDEPQMRALFNKLVSQGAGFVLEGRGRRDDGTYLWLQMRGSAIQTDNKQPDIAVIVFNDLTSHRRVEETLRAQVREFVG
jgi:PAS domain S-box-containing protein